MYVRVLFETTWRRERLTAFGARVWSGTRVIGPDVPLQVARIAENFRTGLARELPAVGQCQVPDQAGLPAVRMRAQLTPVLVGFVMVSRNQMVV